MKTVKQILKKPLHFKPDSLELDLNLLNYYVQNQNHPSEFQKIISSHLADELLKTRIGWSRKTVRNLIDYNEVILISTDFSVMDYFGIVEGWLNDNIDMIIISGVFIYTKLNYNRILKLYDKLGYSKFKFFKLVLESYIWKCFTQGKNPIQCMKSNYRLHYVERS